LLEYLRTLGGEVWHTPESCLDARHFQYKKYSYIERKLDFGPTPATRY
jgi:hypothetical protein